MSGTTITLDSVEATATRPGASEAAPSTASSPDYVSPPTGATATTSGITPTGGDDMTLMVDGKVWAGWEEISLMRSCETCPSSFNITISERYPGELSAVVIEPGQTCVVKIGHDVVLTGYVDRYVPIIDGRQHSVRILGRSKVQDLVDCSALFDTFQISGQTVSQIARTLAGKYGINVKASGDDPLLPQLNLQLGETVWDVIERICRFAKLLCYDNPEGDLVLAPVSKDKHSSGAEQGTNVEAAQISYGMDGRFQEYRVYPLSIQPLMQAEQSAGGSGISGPLAIARDDAVKRNRVRIIILEHGAGSGSLQQAAQQRADWEAGRRRGRSEAVTVIVDSWRDSKGMLWQPNRLIPLDIPACKLKKAEWIIGDVTYQKGRQGTVATIVAMPAHAFDPQYDPLVPYNWQLEQAASPPSANPDFNPRRGERPGGV